MLSDFRGHDATDEEMRNLSATEARQIYQQDFIDRPSFHLIGSDPLRAVLVDFGVNSSPATAIMALQKCLGLPQDGIIGAQTLHAANTAAPETLGDAVLWERMGHCCRLAAKDPTQLENLVGWYNRIARQAAALAKGG
jgi:lysozyme family protein